MGRVVWGRSECCRKGNDNFNNLSVNSSFSEDAWAGRTEDSDLKD
jgi:hypothetical protein